MKYYPINVTLEVTNGCNLRCKHCYSLAGDKLENELTLTEIRDVLKDLKDMGSMEIDIGGGEPLLRSDIFDIIETIQKRDFEITLLTNGTLIDKKIVNRLKDYSIKHIQLSLDGLKESHDGLRGKGTFSLATNAMRLLQSEDIRCAIRMTATRSSLSDIEDIVKLAIHYGAYKFGVVRFFPAGRGMAYKEDLMLNASEMLVFHRTIKEIYRQYGDRIEITADPCGFFEGKIFKVFKDSGTIMCPCGKTQCIIKSNGIVSPCEIATLYAGNIRTKKFSEIWQNASIFKVFRNFDPDLLKGSCSSCTNKSVCGGYCRALALIHKGDIYAEDITCYHTLLKNA